jgi:excisionase family DNA binding protein
MSVHTKPPPGAVKTAHVTETWSNQTLLTLSRAAQYVICTPRYLQKQIRAGRLRVLKPTGKLVRIRRSDLEKFLESGATIGGAQ